MPCGVLEAVSTARNSSSSAISTMAIDAVVEVALADR